MQELRRIGPRKVLEGLCLERAVKNSLQATHRIRQKRGPSQSTANKPFTPGSQPHAFVAHHRDPAHRRACAGTINSAVPMQSLIKAAPGALSTAKREEALKRHTLKHQAFAASQGQRPDTPALCGMYAQHTTPAPATPHRRSTFQQRFPSESSCRSREVACSLHSLDVLGGLWGNEKGTRPRHRGSFLRTPAPPSMLRSSSQPSSSRTGLHQPWLKMPPHLQP